MEKFKSGITNTLADLPKSKDEVLELKENFAQHLQRYPALAKVEEATKMKREDVVGLLLLALSLVLVGGVFIKPIGIFMTRLFGFVYPCYKSFKAIESENKEDDTQWLMYWMVFAFFAMLEETALKRVEPIAPFFFMWKIAFLLWCYLPRTQGAAFIYVEIISPAFKRVTQVIQDKLGKVKED